MDFDLDAETGTFRDEVRAFLDEVITPDVADRVYRTGVSHDGEFVRRMAERGWLGPSWEGIDGEAPLDVYRYSVLEEELNRTEAPFYLMSTTEMVANVIRAVGTDELKDAVLPGFLRGELTIALGMTEPEVGSDVAGVRTRARPDRDHWIVDGQKMFTTNAHVA